MGFLHQLHLLLWKNVSLKRRGPWVLAFEIFIPLVLFFILLGLRQKKPAIPVKEAFYSAAPLTSAGIIPVMQSLCPDGQRDEFGFLQYKNSTVTQLLERIGEVVEQNHLFMSDRPSLGEELESLQQHLESLSSAQSPLENRFNSSHERWRSVRVSWLWDDAVSYYIIKLCKLIFSASPQGILLTGAVLEMLTCGEDGNSELNKILLVPEKQQSLLQAYQTAMCGGEAEQRAEHFREISEELRDQIDTQRLRLEQANASVLPVQTHLGSLLKDLAEVERLLRDVDLLSGLAKLLPKGACAGHQAPPSASNATWSSNSTTWGPNTTDGGVDGGAEGSAGKEAEPENPHSQFSAFVQLWAGLQPILCGNNRIIEPEALKQGNMSSLGFTSKEQRNLGLLVHLMTTNPKILYSPIGSQVDKVIQKANETFAFVGNVTHYAKVWLNISAELRAFLEEGKLHNHLAWLQQVHAIYCTHPERASLLMFQVSVDIFKGFPDEESIVNYTLNQAYHDNVSVFASVIFQTNKDGSLPPHVQYKIRQNSSFTEKTNEIRRAYWRPGPNTGGKFYFLYGFVWIQDMMERAIINTFVGHDVVEPGNYVQMFPYPCYTRDDFLFVIEHMMPLCMVISWVYSVAMMIQHIVAEKEHRLKEVMKMMGLNNAVHWVAWFITGFVQLSISVTALTAILKYGKVLLHSDPFIIWLFLTIYAIATIMFCFLVSVIYSKAKLASACGGIIYFLSYVPYMYVAIREEVAHDKITAFEKCIASLMSTTAFGLGSKYFALYEVAGVGIQWRTINQSPVEGDDFNLLLSIVMLIIDATVYGVLTWYIEAVHPGMYGLPRPWYFPLQKSYWLGSGRIETWEWPWGSSARLSVMEEDQACAMEHRRSGTTDLQSCEGSDDLINDVMCLNSRMIEDLELSNKRHSLVQTLSGGMKRKLSVAIAFVGGSRAVILDEPTAGVDPYARRAIWDLILKYKQGRTILLSTHHMDEADLLGDRIAIISHGKLKCCGSPLFLKSTYGDGYKLTLVKNVAPSSSMSPCSESRVTQFIRQYVASCLLVSDSNTELSYVLPSEAVKKGCFERLFQALEQSLESLALTSFGVMDTTLEEVFLKVSEEDLSMENSDAAVVGAATRPEVELSNLVMCSRLSPSQASLRSDSSLGSVRGDEGGPYSDFYGEYCPLFNNNQDPDSASLREPVVLEGQGSFKLEGWWLKLRQFHGLIVKRFHCAKRNTKGLFSQILLPAFFVCVAMTVALSVPEIGDLPPLILSPSQYHNYTQPRGNFIPYANEDRLQYRSKLSPDANPQKIVNTLRLPSGVGATCVLKTPFNSTLDQLAQTLNPYANNSKTLAARYFDSMCLDSFTQGVPLSNFVPPPPSPAPSDDPEHFEDGLWNYTATPPTTVHEMVTSPPPLPLSIHEPVRCICSMQGTGFSCPSGVGGRPPLMKVVTGDILVDITGRNVSEYLLYTSDRLRLHRYGGLTVGNIQKSVPASFGRKTPPMVRKIAVRRSAQVLYNNKGYHSMPTYLNVLNNAILRANMPLSKGNPAAYGITVTNHPMNRTSASLSLDYLLQGTDVVIAIFIIVAMSFVPASFVVFLVAEKSTKAKHLQFVSGCDPVIYWLANYIWDMLNYLVPATCCILILFVFDLPAYTSPKNFPAVLSLFLLYGWSITPIMYPASFWFEVPSTAYVFLIVINLFIGITATVATFLLQLFEHDKDLKLVNSYLKSCFLIFPNYNLGHGLMEMAYNEYINEYYAKIGQFDKVKSPFEWDIVTRGLVAMTIEGFVGFLITILCQYNFLRKPQRMPVNSQPIEDDDVDVSRERRRVLRGDAENDMLKIENLTKVYKSRKMGRILAVDRLCLGVRPGECFGLLGVNGAGKTTTFKMLTGDESTTGGEAFIGGHSILKELLRVQQSIGYCPQFDALFEDLTAREHLELYTRLRGIPWKDEERVVQWALEKLELSKYADKPAGTYSGGNKRKLSTAIALIGYPSLIFLDEPTTGMDPKARRFLWNLILDIIKTGRSVVLTSHSMEECEALCTRLGIMVNGRFKCLGSIQHLKNRFGDGYMITVRTKTTASVKEVIRFFNRNFPEAILKERHHTKIQYQLKSERISLAQVFSKMEQVVEVLSIEDYSVSQTTLDNVFVNFAKKQSDNLEQQESSPSNGGQSPLQRFLSILRPRPANTELSALVSEEPEELESDDDEGLISFEEERVQLSFNTDTLC
uniref:ATP binding cassette subfamily A member 2 n=1 Tax=Astyanax mexicanus TaxID=7994 RepID=W5KXQ3_ASTMX